MEKYKNVKVSYINGCKVTSKTLVLTPDEEERKLAEIKLMFVNLTSTRITKEKNT